MCLVTLRPVFSLREHLFSSMPTDERSYPQSLVKDLDAGWVARTSTRARCKKLASKTMW